MAMTPTPQASTNQNQPPVGVKEEEFSSESGGAISDVGGASTPHTGTPLSTANSESADGIDAPIGEREARSAGNPSSALVMVSAIESTNPGWVKRETTEVQQKQQSLGEEEQQHATEANGEERVRPYRDNHYRDSGASGQNDEQTVAGAKRHRGDLVDASGNDIGGEEPGAPVLAETEVNTLHKKTKIENSDERPVSPVRDDHLDDARWANRGIDSQQQEQEQQPHPSPVFVSTGVSREIISIASHGKYD